VASVSLAVVFGSLVVVVVVVLVLGGLAVPIDVP